MARQMKARRLETCLLCQRPVLKGMTIMKDYEFGLWVHAACLMKKLHADNKTEGKTPPE